MPRAISCTNVIATIGIDIGKNTFHVIGLDDKGGFWGNHRACVNLPAQPALSHSDALSFLGNPSTKDKDLTFLVFPKLPGFFAQCSPQSVAPPGSFSK
jgi:hypothetical protein